MSRPEGTVMSPEKRPDGSWRYPVQVVLQTWGKWETGRAVFELVGWASDLEHRKKLERCLR